MIARVLGSLREVDRFRHAHAVEHLAAGQVLLHQHADHALLQPVRTLAIHGVPAHAADALHLVLLDREQDFARAGIARDDAKFGAEHVVEQHRRVARGAARLRRAQDQLGRVRVFDRLDRRVGAHIAVVRGGLRAAEIDQRGGIVVELAFAGVACPQRIGDHARRGRADRGAVLGGDIVDVRRRDMAAGARHVDRQHRRVAGDVPAKVTRHQPRIAVVAATRDRADDKADGLTAVEVRDGVLCGGLRCQFPSAPLRNHD